MDPVVHYAISLLAISGLGGTRLPVLLIVSLVGVLPDLDVFIGRHRGPTHSLVVPLIGLLTLLAIGAEGLPLVSMFLYALHIVLDLFTGPTPVLWPLKDTQYRAVLSLEGVVRSPPKVLRLVVGLERNSPAPEKVSMIAGESLVLLAVALALTLLAG